MKTEEQKAIEAFKECFKNPGAFTEYIMTLPYRRKPKEVKKEEEHN